MSFIDQFKSIFGAKKPQLQTAIQQPNTIVFGNVGLGRINSQYPYDSQLLSKNGYPAMAIDGRKAVLTEWFYQPLRGQPRRVDTNELKRLAQTYWVAACVNTILDEVSSIKWDIVPKEEYLLQADSPEVVAEAKRIKDFLNNPNRNQESWNDLQRGLIRDILEIDAGCLIKTFSKDSYDFENTEPVSNQPQLKPQGQRQLVELYVRDGGSFLKDVDMWGGVRGYWQYSYVTPSMPRWFDKDEILYIMQHPRPAAPYGFSVLQSIMEIVYSLHYSVLYNKTFFTAQGVPAGVLTLPDTSDVDNVRMKEDFYNNTQGKPFQIPWINKKAEFIRFALNNDELQFLQTQQWYGKLVISAYKLTPAELGFYEDVNRSTAQGQSSAVRRKGIKPLLNILQYAYNTGILSELNSKYTEFKFVEHDLEEEMQKKQGDEIDLRNGIVTINEVRRQRGLDPVEWGNGPSGEIVMSDNSDETDPESENANDDKKSDQTIPVGGGKPNAPPEKKEQYINNESRHKTCINCDSKISINKAKCTQCSGIVFTEA